jgi:hypothetical protein
MVKREKKVNLNASVLDSMSEVWSGAGLLDTYIGTYVMKIAEFGL